jgi:hypothetical protein
MKPDHKPETDQLLRAAFRRLIESVWAHGKPPSRHASDHAASESAVDLTDRSTVTLAVPAAPLSFQPGAILAQRYRLVHFLGRGGMGEVYRADDLLLDQTVALKFLPTAASANSAKLSRFRNEVRMARQISHPHVCRVYDIGEAEGLTYLSMEYVDGENLASLLRRIGKLPLEKALEIARQLCAGLAAAHDKGVIHRDLKPANIMLDGRGEVRITDFGLAGMADQIRDIRSGTPAYMSPEQLADREVTARSDIYSLGIILHELLTGKRPPIPAGKIDLDPSVERVIGRCLQLDPSSRPPSALSVSAALPGGDPLAAALARGELPAPELVANAGPAEGLRPLVAVTCLAVVIIGLGFLSVLGQQHALINQIPMENSTEVLAAKAREITKSFGYGDRPADTLSAWSYDMDYLDYASRQKDAVARGPRFYAPYPPAVYFWYRQSLRYPNVPELGEDLATFNRDALAPDMQAVVLDSEGKLLEFHAHPPADTPTGEQAEAFDWDRLFAAAALDSGRFHPVPAELTPTAAFDARAAWTNSGGAEAPLRIEAAAYQGRPVFFRVLGRWARPNQPPSASFGGFSLPAFILFVIAWPLAAGLFAWRNNRRGRGDRSGALRLAGFGFVLMLCEQLAGSHHVASATEFVVLFDALRYAITGGCISWISYMALEPQVRKRSPASLISWTRLLDGRFRDPLVGGHLLVGITLAVAAMCATEAFFNLPFLATSAPTLPWSGAAPSLSLGLWRVIVGVAGGLIYMFILNLISIRIRNQWLAGSLFVLVVALILAPGYNVASFVAVLRPAVLLSAVAIALVRFGVLAAVALVYATAVRTLPLTTNFSTWYAPVALSGIAALVALAIFGFITTLLSRVRLGTAMLPESGKV